MYFLMCFLVHVFGTITGKITTVYLTPRYYWLVTGVNLYTLVYYSIIIPISTL